MLFSAIFTLAQVVVQSREEKEGRLHLELRVQLKHPLEEAAERHLPQSLLQHQQGALSEVPVG